MAIGDRAAAAALMVYESTQDKRLGYENDNQRGDELADEMTARVNADNLKLDRTTVRIQQADPGGPDGTIWISWA